MAFSYAEFKVQFPDPQFPVATYPQVTVEAYAENALCYISTGCRLTGTCWVFALNLMTAHLLKLNDIIISGGSLAVATSASVGGVSVSLQPPPASNKSQYSWWLSTTPYGVQLAALLSKIAAPGFYAGGSQARGGFRGPTGRFL
jgi:hypothetical protein